jgi:peptidoglycan/xylan/chitin deacetylase (PgdA/CDA1 family)
MLKFKVVLVLFFLSVLVVFIGFESHASLLWLILGLVLIWITIIFLASMSMSWQFFVEAITRKKLCKKPYFAITFDDGPNPTYTPIVLDILKKHNAKATFFLIGKEMEKFPELVKQIINDGHTLGNHSYSHAVNSGFFSKKEWLEELKKTNKILEGLEHKVEFFRPPFGVTTPNLAKVIKQTQLKVIGWNKRSFDTFFKNETNILNRVAKNLKAGDIILLHDKQANCVPVLERLLQIANQNQLQAVTINTLLHEN